MGVSWGTNGVRAMVRLILCLIVFSIPLFLPVYSQITELTVKVNGEPLNFTDVQPYIDEQTGAAMVPAREIAERLGAAVEWDRALKQVTFRHQQTIASFIIGQQVISLNGKQVALDAPAGLDHNRTLVPLRAVGESLGADVDWVGERNVILITSADKAHKSTWIWNSRLIETEGDSILEFAVNHKLTALYLPYETFPAQDVYRNFIGKANKLGIRVEALAGRSDWIYSRNHSRIQQWIAAVTRYNAAAEATERFQGFHVDVEPYTLDMWQTDQPAVLQMWMETIRLIESEVRKADRSMTMAFDIPFWLNKCAIAGSNYSFSAWLLEKADQVVIMAYRNTAMGGNGIIASAKAIMLEAGKLNKQAIVAVDTLPSTEADYTTFYNSKASLMDAELRQVKETLSPYPSYAGIAVHDYVRWIALMNAGRGAGSPDEKEEETR
ncbi:copper amine oxidase N-terminal domain-containing protein [Paenibacillus athensensis]|uniref:Copper amine oxidase-like N-terminal domain-containing protein n=1 Tax=Paenibacillus athensensis TaxID=1967502 RepID=A0A4Y8PZJ9_9BACL|nr:stalk domain-containing protein [Paenibacillus athensensis]MCD1259669.1 copper amine oxidase N-terminal domain-containing protein [Paenibacillus athensensis]